MVVSWYLSVVSFSVFSADPSASWGMEVPGKPKEAARGARAQAAGALHRLLCVLNMFESNESTSERKQTRVNINKRL